MRQKRIGFGTKGTLLLACAMAFMVQIIPVLMRYNDALSVLEAGLPGMVDNPFVTVMAVIVRPV